MTTNDDSLPIYALRVLPRAEQDILAATQQMADTAGDAFAEDWQEGLFTAISSLATLPSRCALAREETYFKREVRQLLYRKTAGSAAYRILFRIAGGAQDAPTVSILHVRHGAQAPLTQAEARNIENQKE